MMLSIFICRKLRSRSGTLFARLVGRKPILTYHCDLQMPPVWYGKAVDSFTVLNNLVACSLAAAIVTNTEDFARHSQVLARFNSAGAKQGKVHAVIPPIVIAEPSQAGVQAIRAAARVGRAAMPGRLCGAVRA